MAADDSIRNAVQHYCTSIALDRLLVQAAGGNVSWKSGDTLWIKASGTWLADAQTRDIFVPVDKRPLDAAMVLGDYSVSPKVLKGYVLRPSIETLLHALMPHKFVVHLHPVDAVVHLVRCSCKDDLQALLGDTFAWVFVDYHKPGADLARAIHTKLLEKPDAQVALLKNHGVILGAETLVEIERLIQDLSVKLNVEPRLMKSSLAGDKELTSAALDGTSYHVCPEMTMHCLASNPELYQRLDDNWALCPDHVVFLGAQAIRIDDLASLCDMLNSINPAPPFVFVKNMGVLEHSTATPAQMAQLTFYLDVMLRQSHTQALDTLSHEQIASLLNWDAEKYRQSINRTIAT